MRLAIADFRHTRIHGRRFRCLVHTISSGCPRGWHYFKRLAPVVFLCRPAASRCQHELGAVIAPIPTRCSPHLWPSFPHRSAGWTRRSAAAKAPHSEDLLLAKTRVPVLRTGASYPEHVGGDLSARWVSKFEISCRLIAGTGNNALANSNVVVRYQTCLGIFRRAAPSRASKAPTTQLSIPTKSGKLLNPHFRQLGTSARPSCSPPENPSPRRSDRPAMTISRISHRYPPVAHHSRYRRGLRASNQSVGRK